jgi:hypothetical protein
VIVARRVEIFVFLGLDVRDVDLIDGANRLSISEPLFMFRSLVWTIARRLPGVWWAKSRTTKFTPSIVITIPRRISVALIIMAIRISLVCTSAVSRGSSDISPQM